MATQNLIQIKKTSVSGRAANTTTLVNPAELAINMTDGIMYSTNGTVVFEIGANNTVVNISDRLNVNKINLPTSNIVSNSFTSSSTSAQVCDSYPVSYKTAKYIAQITFGTSVHAMEILMINNGVDVDISQYGEVFSNASLGSFSANLNGGVIELVVTPVNSLAIVKVFRTTLV